MSLKLIAFPDVETSDKDGLLCHGGDLSPLMLVSAYAQGIFPWFNKGEPILWWSPNPRMVFYPSEVKAWDTVQSAIRKHQWQITTDSDFEGVIQQCSRVPRKGQSGTWITREMREAYILLHQQGVAHSVEVWEDTQLVGGLYGLSLGRVFCGESMFHLRSGASKAAFFYLAAKLSDMGYQLIDGQIPNTHLRNLGGREMSRQEYIGILQSTLASDEWFMPWR